MHSHIRRLLISGSILATCLQGVGEDIATISGRTFREVTFGAADEDGVRMKHREGEERIYFYDLPEAVQKRLGFDAQAALRRKTQEVERLRAELAAAKGGIAPVVTAPASGAPMAVAGAGARVISPRKPELWQNLSPTPAANALPALKEGELVTVFDLVNHFRTDPAAAEARYRRKTFKLEGVIERMEEGTFTRSVKLVLESPDPTIRVVCNTAPPEAFKSTYTKAEGTVMMANDGRGTFAWLRAGERVVVTAHLGGLKDGALQLSRCEFVR